MNDTARWLILLAILAFTVWLVCGCETAHMTRPDGTTIRRTALFQHLSASDVTAFDADGKPVVIIHGLQSDATAQIVSALSDLSSAAAKLAPLAKGIP